MRCWYTDGNRGKKVLNYELDEADKEDIVDQLCEIYLNGYSLETEISLMLLCESSDEMIEIEVNMNDYRDEILKRC